MSGRDLEVLEWIARYGVVPRGAVVVRAGTGRSVTFDRERRLREAGLIEVQPPFVAGGALLLPTRRGLAACGRPELRTARFSPHTTGGAIDLTLCSREGEPLDMGGEFDELSERSEPGHYEREDLGAVETIYRDRRRLLNAVMTQAGFWPFPTEWWHFEYGTASWAKANHCDAQYGFVSAS